MIRALVPGIGPKYTKYYIGLAMSGSTAQNFVSFVPSKNHVIVQFRIAQDDDLSRRLNDSDLNVVVYDKQWGYYRIRVRQPDLEDNERCNTLSELISLAHAAYPGNR